MRERKSLRSQVDSLSFTLTKTDALSIGQTLHVCALKIIFSPEFNVAISVGINITVYIYLSVSHVSRIVRQNHIYCPEQIYSQVVTLVQSSKYLNK